jgi:DNA-binding GntR family transcriptional regulator
MLRSPTQAKEFIEMDTRFHNALVRATGNETLTRTYDGLRDRQVRAGLVALGQAPDRQQSVLDEHQEIVDSLTAGDVERAVRAIDSHLQETLRVQLRS